MPTDRNKLKKIFSDDPATLQAIEAREQTELLKELVKANLQEDQTETSVVRTKIEFLKGDDGKTPKKGIDYFTEEESNELLGKVTPIKGTHYFDGIDGKDGIDGVDGIDGRPGLPGKDGKDGLDGTSVTADDVISALTEKKLPVEVVEGAITEKDVNKLLKKINVTPASISDLGQRISSLRADVERNYGGHGGSGGGGSGTVTSVSVVSANGLAGTVATSTTTPAITLSTSITGVLKGNGTAISAAAAGTDYVAPGSITTDGITMNTARLLGRSTASAGAVEEINLGTGLSFSGTTLNSTAATAPGGSDTQLQYNNASAFGGISGATSNGTNLNLKDSTLFIQDDGDATKQAQFQLSGITTGTTRTLTVQNSNGTIAYLSDVTAITPPFVDTQTIIKGSADATKLLRFEVDGFTTGTTRVLTPPNTDATIGGLEVIQTWTAANTWSAAQTWNASSSFGNAALYFGGLAGVFPFLYYNLAETPDTLYLGTGSAANSIIIAEAADVGFDHAHAQVTDPTLFIHSHNQSTTQWLGLNHDGTNGVIQVGTGAIDIKQRILLPAGAANPAAITFGGVLGLYGSGSGVAFSNSGAATMAVNSDGPQLGSNKGYMWTDNTDPTAGTRDLFLMRETTATLRLGAAAAASPVNQTIISQSGTGTDKTGGSLTLAGGVGTGTGISGDIATQTSVVLGTGTTAQTLGDRSRILAKYTTLTESSATAFASVTVGTGTVAGGVIMYTVEANDGTDFQALSGIAPYSIANKGGTLTMTLGTDSQASATSASTLTGTLTMVDAGSGVMQFKMNAVSGLTQTVLRINCQIRKNFGTGAIAAI